MIKLISKRKKAIACFFLVLMLNELLMPASAYALTGGPSQPEVQSFEPVDTNRMVDPFTGDFVYNIPLLDVEGYPINISYHSGITMDQEASWVGLGWNINPGVINRSMRGLPDDFEGDAIIKEHNIRTNWTAGVDIGAGFEPVALPIGFGGNMGIYYNNYKGVGFKGGVNFNFSFSLQGAKDKKTGGLGGSVGLGLSFDSQEGIGVSPSVGLSMEKESSDGQTKTGGSLNMGLSYNNRSGLGALTMSASASISHSNEKKYLSDYKSDKLTGKHTADKSDLQKHNRAMNGNASISFANAAVTPNIEMPMENFAFTGKFKIGGLVPSIDFHISGDITGSYNQQKLASHRDVLPGYGYMYFDKAAQNPRALLDFNREKDQPFRKPNPHSGDVGTPIMAIPNYEFDVLSVTGQGIGGSYRPMRGDLGAVYDHLAQSKSSSGAVNIDIGLGGIASIGVDFNVTLVNTTTSYWDDGNDLHHLLSFYPEDNTLYEPFYFTNIGEKTINDQAFYDAIGDIDPVRPKIDGWWLSQYATSTMERYKGSVKQNDFPLNTFKKAKRAKRNQAISFLTANESVAALDTAILNYPENSYPIENCGNLGVPVINRMVHSNQRKSHISEVTVLGTDGKRYVYGIPAYNRKQKEATFNVHPEGGNIDSGLVKYTQGDNTIGNQIGFDNYFTSEQIPDFSHSFLLTGVLSSDYVDITGNGISDDDLGDAVRINYTRVYDKDNGLYKWRSPVDENMANYQEGFKTNKFDDKGSYVYGEKELWYVNSIESKTMVAVFRISGREDGLGVKGENGGIDANMRMRKLDRIDLYSKSDRINYGENAIPIKSAFFEYSYRLCPGVLNNTHTAVYAPGTTSPNLNQGGKLTLEKIYFTYQKNGKGRLNPYVFHYDGTGGNINPRYHIKHYDRWGNYKQNSDASISVPEAEFPYTIQNAALSDAYAGAWSLSSIDIPTGGTIKVKLEADRYAYVQDQRAMQMYQIYGLGHGTAASTGNTLYTSNDPFSTTYNTTLYIKVDDPITSSSPADIQEEIKQKYMQGIDNMYFRVSAVMPDPSRPQDAEYVPGYTRIHSYGLCSNNGIVKNLIYIELEAVPIGNNGLPNANPIQKTLLQFLRMNLPFLAYPGSQQTSGDLSDIIKALIAPLFDMQNIFFGFSRSAIMRGWCKELKLEKSWVRLNNPGMNKLGGGCRVKQVTIVDNWNNMVTGEAQAEYGQVYDYTMVDDVTGKIISSGDAEYEPMVGNDENPFRQPLFYTQNTPLAPHNQFFVELPLGESFFPSPAVGYRQVRVSSYGSTLVPQEKRTGYTIHKFYTGYDFPIFTDHTPLSANSKRTPSIFQILQLPSIEHFLGSQGFQIELNDMHGKPRSEEIYDNNGSPISKTTYEYEVENPAALHKKLKTNVPVMKPDGSVTTENVGKEVELMFDSRKQETITQGGGGLIQVDIDYIPPFLIIPIPTYFPAFAREEARFKSLTSMKVVRRYGLIKSVTTQQYGSQVKGENLLFDSETGEVLLTSTRNEFEDPIYNFTMPAHTAYTGMAPASQNVGAHFTNVFLSNGAITSPTSIINYFTPGDEVLFMSKYTFTVLGIQYSWDYSKKLWVIDPHSMDPSAPHQTIFVDQSGKPFTAYSTTNPGTMKIVRSGHRNLQNNPISTLTLLSSPIHSGMVSPTVADNILNTTNTEYSEKWKVNCDKLPVTECDSCQKPKCECMGDLMTQVLAIINGSSPFPLSGDSVFVNTTCLDSCFWKNGQSSTADLGSRRHFYALPNSPDPLHPYDINAPYYRAIVGRCILTISRTTMPFYPTGSRPLNSLVNLNGNDEIIYGNVCSTVCDFYATTGEYYLPSISTGGPIVPYLASIYCPKLCMQTCENLLIDTPINPYRYGMLGSWRPAKQWAYRDLRSPGSIVSGGVTHIRTEGVYASYSPFWVYNSTEAAYTKNPSLASEYIDATTITKYNPKGAEIENRDAAGIYSAAQFGYLYTQAVAVAKNARYKDIGFDGFEDYDFVTDCINPCRQDHFDFREALCKGCTTYNAILDSTTSHSGHKSIKVIGASGGTARMSRDLIKDQDLPGLQFDAVKKLYRLQQDGCLPKFSPDSDRYFISAWVREADSCIGLSYTNCQLKVSFNGSADAYIFKPSGHIIDGWQRIEGVFRMPGSVASQIYIDLMGLNGEDVYFDDVRAQPFNSSMKGYVYDARSLRLMAELDENNFASFYEYDDEGGLIRIKKETERGIMTIQESRSVLKK